MSGIILPKDHILYTSAAEIERICAPLIEYFQLGYFSFLRIYNDGTRAHLSMNPDVQEFFYKKFMIYANDYQVFNATHTYTRGYFRWDEQIDDKVHYDFQSYFWIGKGITLIDKQDDYVELFCFAGGCMNDPATRRFVNNLDLLDQFVNYFKQRAADLILQAEEQRILTPLIDHDWSPTLKRQLHSKIANPERQEFISAISPEKEKINITFRERECIECLLQGLSSKEIGRKLEISPRTVERHLENIKLKFNCSKVTQILKKATDLEIFKL